MSAAVQSDVATLLLEGIARSGVTDVVVSPGSRNTPFVLAAQRAGLREHVVIDERAAAFFALGMARASGRPVLLSCTSGSAGAHYLPAIVEASSAHVPLIAMTADRPHDLAQCGAPQTIDQVGLFGAHVRKSFDVSVPDDRAGQLDAALRVAAQAVAASLGPAPGPVHVNVRAAKPLEPEAPNDATEHALHRATTKALARGPTRVWAARAMPHPDAIRALAESCRRAERGLIVCGPAPLARRHERDAVLALARATGFPLAAEATSQVRFAPLESVRDIVVADGLLPAMRSVRVRERIAADLVIQIGAPPVASGWELWCSEQRARERWVIDPHGWCDPFGRADALVSADVGATADALVSALESGAVSRSREPWTREVVAASDAWWHAVERTGADVLDETNVVRAIVDSLPSRALLSIGNSRAVRLLDACRRAPAGLAVMSQRGASGIDGLVAGSVGAAGAWDGPVVLVLGDVSFVHDVGALELVRRVSSTLVIVVVHNDGGRIFEELPVARAWGERDAAWTTPHGLAIAPIARSFGIAATTVTGLAELRAEMAVGTGRNAATIVEVVVPPEAERARRGRTDEALEAWCPAKEQRR